jgi:hypothetical protein
MAIDVRAVKLVVRPHQPVRQFVLACLGVVLIVLVAWIVLDYGHWRAIYGTMSGSSRLADGASFWASTQEAALDAESLRERVAILERAAQIDSEAYARVQAHVREMQDDILELKEEVEFYRGVVAAAKKASGLRIHGLRLSGLDAAGHYRYKLVLTNVHKDDKVVSGTVSGQILGTLNGAARTLDMAALVNPGGGALTYSFRQFCRLEGELTLPAGFRPESVRIALREEAGKAVGEEQRYAWDQLID